jgi:hypothetical protein
MEHIRIICPHCNYSRGIPRDKAPARSVTATCPRCRKTFSFDPAAAPTEPLGQVEGTPLSPPAPPKAPPPREAPSAAGRPPHRHELRGIGELLVDAWGQFQRRFGVLFGAYLLSLLAIGLPLLAGMGAGMAVRDLSVAAAALCMLLAFVGSTAGFCWGWGACVAASLDDALDIRAAYARGKEKILPFAFVTFLASFVICGGFLLFIVPGLVFSVWFFFATFILFDDDSRGMSALLKSRAYVRGRWFEVFLRLVVIWACTAILGAIPVVGPLISLVAAPYVLVYHALLFKDLKEVAGQVEYPCGYGDKAKWISIALIGYLLIPALIIATAGSTIYRQLAPLGCGGGAIGKLPSLFADEGEAEKTQQGGIMKAPVAHNEG